MNEWRRSTRGWNCDSSVWGKGEMGVAKLQWMIILNRMGASCTAGSGEADGGRDGGVGTGMFELIVQLGRTGGGCLELFQLS